MLYAHRRKKRRPSSDVDTCASDETAIGPRGPDLFSAGLSSLSFRGADSPQRASSRPASAPPPHARPSFAAPLPAPSAIPPAETADEAYAPLLWPLLPTTSSSPPPPPFPS